MSWTKEEMLLVDAEAGLKWASEGEFSARITPPQARALRKELQRLRARTEASGQVLIDQHLDREADLSIFFDTATP